MLSVQIKKDANKCLKLKLAIDTLKMQKKFRLSFKQKTDAKSTPSYFLGPTFIGN